MLTSGTNRVAYNVDDMIAIELEYPSAVREFGIYRPEKWLKTVFPNKKHEKFACYTLRGPDCLNLIDESYTMYPVGDGVDDIVIQSLLKLAAAKENRAVELDEVKITRDRPIWPAHEGQRKITITVK